MSLNYLLKIRYLNALVMVSCLVFFGIASFAQDAEILDPVLVSIERGSPEAYCAREHSNVSADICVRCFSRFIEILRDSKNLERAESSMEQCIDVAQQSATAETEVGATAPTTSHGRATESDQNQNRQPTPSQTIVSNLDKASEEDIFKAACKVENQKASECCMYPERCITGVDGQASENEGAIGKILGVVAGVSMGVSQNSVSQMCGTMSTVSQAMTAMNGYLAYRCNHHVRQCSSTCKSEQTDFKSRYAELTEACEFSPGNTACGDYRMVLNRYTTAIDECGSMDARSVQLAQQAIASQMANKYADMCKDLIAGKADPGADPFQVDCSSQANLSAPACQAECNRPENAGVPVCQEYLRRVAGGNTNTNSGGSLNTTGNGMFDDLTGENEANQLANMEDVAATPQKAVGGGTGQGGGGGLTGGEGGADGGASGSGNAVGESVGYNADINKGVMAGGGYSAGAGRNPSSTSAGDGEGESSIFGRKFNLSDFLPKGAMPGKATASLRGLASVSEISASNTDIFKKITDRFYQICLKDALLDCSTLRKVKGR